MDKNSLRKKFLAERRALPSQELDRRNRLIFQYFMDFVAQSDHEVYHCFLPIENNAEVNTWPMVAYLLEQDKKVVVSKSDLHVNTLTNYYYESEEQMAINKWGIPEPTGGEEAESEEIDVVLIPLIVFDKSGHRVGYGKGYYDRFLQSCRQDVMKTGLSLLAPIDIIPDTASHDIPMDNCLSPVGIHNF
ncbi:MAG: 5-formyltetrahydrofolate cyclo-ligase [Cyclobacteriaceae bacterium]